MVAYFLLAEEVHLFLILSEVIILNPFQLTRVEEVLHS